MTVNPITEGDVLRRAPDGLSVFDDEVIGRNVRNRRFMFDRNIVVESNDPISRVYTRILRQRRQRSGTIIAGMHDNRLLDHKHHQQGETAVITHVT